jgi:hypothetical protein
LDGDGGMGFKVYYDWYKPLMVYSIIYSNNDIWMCFHY